MDGLILTVSGAGVVVIAWQAQHALHWSRAQLLSAVGLALATLVAELFPLHLRHSTQTETFSITDVVWTTGLMLTSASPLLIAVVVGVLVSQIVRRLPLHKIAFNAGQFVTAMWLAETVFTLVPHSGPLHPTTWAAAALAMSLNFVVNEGLVALVISFMEHESVRSIVRDSLGLDMLHTVGNIAIGIIAAVMWELTPAGVVLAALPMMLSYLAYARSLRNLRERDRMHDLYQAGQVLLERLETEEDFRPFLRLVARMMDSTAAEIVLFRDGRTFVHDASGVVSVTPQQDGLSDGAPPGYHRARPEAAVRTATIGAAEDPMGSLVVFRRNPLSPAAQSLLEALAGQVYVKLRHSTVFARSVAKEQELTRIISSSSDGIFVIGDDGRIQSWNPAMERITGVTVEDAVGRQLPDVLATPPGANDVWRPFGSSSAATGDGIETGTFIRSDGTIGWVRFSRSALRTPDGALSGTVVVARDVSADIQAEQAKANFISAISHELRSPLTPLKGYLSLLSSGQMVVGTQEAQESFGAMLRQADRLERLINDLIDSSQLEMGQQVVQPEKVDLVKVVAAVVARSEREHGLKVLFEPRCREALSFADRARVQQVLVNLVSNARKYSPPASPVRIQVERQARMCVISVTDGGEGIPPSEQERIFERFYRVDNGSTRSIGGVGLGLYIAKLLVESMAGRLWVSSDPGEGSTFSFSLPLVHGAQMEPPLVSELR